MNKILKYGIFGLTAAMLLAGCTKKETKTFSGDFGSVTLGNYKGMEIDMSEAAGQESQAQITSEVTDEELDDLITQYLENYPEYIEVTDRPAQNGDVVNIDFVGMIDEIAFEGGTAAGYSLELGSHSFIDGFEEGLVGANKGDELSLNLTFPDPYTNNPDLAGQPVVFDVTVNSIEEKRTSEFNEAFVQRISDLTTVEEFRDDLRENIVSYKESQIKAQDNMKRFLAIQAVIDEAVFELQQEAVQAEYDKNYEAVQSSAEMNGMSLEEYLETQGMTIADCEAQLKEKSEDIAKQQLIVDAICQFEGITVTDEARQIMADNQGATLEELNQYYGQETIDQVATIYAVADFLVANTVFK